MGWKDFFRRSKEKIGESCLLLSFNIAAGATVLLPLFLWMVARLVNGGDNDGGGGGEDNSWWSTWGNRDGEGGWWGNNNQAEGEQGGAALGFVYFWSLLLFGSIVWYGNRVLERDNKELLKGLLTALIVFTNLAFLLSVLTGGLGIQVEGKEAEEMGWLGQFPACMVLTFVFWILFGAIWSLILYRKIWKPKKESNDNDYQRQSDTAIV